MERAAWAGVGGVGKDGACGWREQADGEWRMKDGGRRKCADSKAEVDAMKVEWWRMQVVAGAESQESLIPMEEERSCKEET